MKYMSKQGKIWLVFVFFMTAALYLDNFVTNPYILLIIPSAYIMGYIIGHRDKSK
jgi:hypothetical protein